MSGESESESEDDYEICECTQCGWEFARGGHKTEWVPNYGPMMGVRVAVCDPCYGTTTVGTLPSPEHRAICYCANLILAAIKPEGQR